MSTIYLFNGIIPKYWSNVAKKNNCFLNEHCSVCTTTFSRTTCFSVLFFLFLVVVCCQFHKEEGRSKTREGYLRFISFVKLLFGINQLVLKGEQKNEQYLCKDEFHQNVFCEIYVKCLSSLWEFFMQGGNLATLDFPNSLTRIFRYRKMSYHLWPI